MKLEKMAALTRARARKFLEEADDDEDEEEEVVHGWSTLPEILLEDIFAFVPQKDRYAAAQVCRRWAEAFHAPRVWDKIEIHNESFMCKKIRFRRISRGNGRYTKTHCAQQKVMSPALFREMLTSVGTHLKSLEFVPIPDYRKIVDMLRALESYLDVNPIYPLRKLKEFKFSFAFTTMETCFEGVQVLGTGGAILDALTSCMGHLQNLKTLHLENLFLDAEDGERILNCLGECDSLRTVNVFNLSKELITPMDLKHFPRLQTLVLSPLQLSEDMVKTLPHAEVLQNVHVVMDEYSGKHVPVMERNHWAEIKEKKPKLVLRLKCQGYFKGELPLIANAPVTEIVYDTPHAEFTPDSLKPILECYKTTLTCYANVHTPCTYSTKASADRAHVALMTLVTSCPNLTTIAIRDMMYSSSLLHAIKTNPNIQNVFARRKGILLKNFFSQASDRKMSLEYHCFLKDNSRSIQSLEHAVSHLLRKPSWKVLPDNIFRKVLA